MEDEIRREELAVCSSIVSADTENFAELVAQAGMNPVTDFVHADLRGCDLSDSDIRGFNFAGADMRGVVGHHITWDETTNFRGADLSGTAFEFDEAQRSFFDDNPDFIRTVQILAASDWLGVELWLGRNDLQDGENDSSARVCFELYNKTNDGYIRSIILRYSRELFASANAYREFLLAELAKPNQPPVLVSCLNIVGRLFASQPQVIRACQTLFAHESEMVRRAALAAIMNGIVGIDVPSAIRAYIRREGSGELRRYYLGRIARRMTETHVQVALERRPSLYRDFNAPITAAQQQKIAETCIPASALSEVALTAEEKAGIDRIHSNRANRESAKNAMLRRKRFLQILNDFAPSGIAFMVAGSEDEETVAY